MCGIFIEVPLQNKDKEKEKEKEKFHDFTELKHRGPHSSSYYTDAQSTIGFHRLAVMDPSIASNQPFVFTVDDKKETIVFLCNGEIYNANALRDAYQLPHIRNDCAVLAEVYVLLYKTGQDQLYHLIKREVKGEFAMVILHYEHNTLKKVVVARDEVGIRPLYYHPYDINSDSLLFVSEIKGAKHIKGSIKEFPPGHIHTYSILPFDVVQVADQDFSTIYHTTCFGYDSFHKTLPYPEESTEEELLDGVRTAVKNSVERRLDADQPFAFLLSGGVDSSIVAAVAACLQDEPLQTFCCGMKGGTDLQYARKMADYLQTEHTEVIFTEEEALQVIPDVIRTVESWDTTTIRASVGQYLVSQYISKHTHNVVLMVGEGPDEVCSSYLFNWYAPNATALDLCAKESVEQIHYYDVKRADRCISRWGLEARVPLLDPEFIKSYWTIPANQRMPFYRGMEKWWLRKAMEDFLPSEICWRRKEAFSDGVSGEKSWFQIIQDDMEKKVSDEEFGRVQSLYPYHTPRTKEAFYYRRVFCEHFGNHRQDIIPAYWQPKWSENGVVTEYVDPSARTLDVYKEK